MSLVPSLAPLAALLLAASVVSQVPPAAAAPPPAPPPTPAPGETYTVACSFSNPAYSGLCRVTEETPKAVSPQAACGRILSCLNDSRCVTKTYCGSTSIRGGWALVSAGKEGSP